MAIWDKTIRRKQTKNSEQQQLKKTNPYNQLKRWRKVAKAYHNQLREDPNFKILESALDEISELKGKPVLT